MITTFQPDKYGCELIEPAANPALNYAQRHWDDEYAADFFIDNDLIAQYDTEHSREG